jgi:hypothetical protein
MIGFCNCGAGSMMLWVRWRLLVRIRIRSTNEFHKCYGGVETLSFICDPIHNRRGPL